MRPVPEVLQFCGASRLGIEDQLGGTYSCYIIAGPAVRLTTPPRDGLSTVHGHDGVTGYGVAPFEE